MIGRIICNTIMFVAFAGNVAYAIFELVRLPKALKACNDCKSDSESVEDTENNKKKYFTYTYFRLSGVCLLFLLIGITTCLLDGLSDIEPYLAILTTEIFIIFIAGSVLNWVYQAIVIKKFQVDLIDRKNDFIKGKIERKKCLNSLCFVIPLIFAFNAAITTYTAILLITL